MYHHVPLPEVMSIAHGSSLRRQPVCIHIWIFSLFVGPKREKSKYFKMNEFTKISYVIGIIYFVHTYVYNSSLLLLSENICGINRPTRVSSIFIGCPVYMPLCHISSLTKATTGNTRVCKNKVNNYEKIQISWGPIHNEIFCPLSFYTHTHTHTHTHTQHYIYIYIIYIYIIYIYIDLF